MIAILFWSGTQNQEGDDASNDVDKNLGFADRLLLLPFTHQEEVVNFLELFLTPSSCVSCQDQLK